MESPFAARDYEQDGRCNQSDGTDAIPPGEVGLLSPSSLHPPENRGNAMAKSVMIPNFLSLESISIHSVRCGSGTVGSASYAFSILWVNGANR